MELCRQAETAIETHFRAPDAVEHLARAFERTRETFLETQPETRAVESAQVLLDIAVQKVVDRLSWRLLCEDGATPESVGVPALLDLCIAAISRKLLLHNAAYKVLEDLMEGQTISTCEKLWDLLEARKDKFNTSEFIPQLGRPTKASLCLLRMSNALLRRLSKTHNSVFCGRILVFLSFMFSLSERSSLNLLGKPNVSNVTVFENQEQYENADSSESSQYLDVPMSEPDQQHSSDNGPIDYNLYRTFWGLQRFCSNHQLATKSAEEWEKFFDELNTVLSAFEGNAFSPDDLERARDLMGGSTSAQSVDASSQGGQEHFFQPKYLTNSRLFRLQLRDPILRECMLSQFLIIFNHLLKAKQPEGCTTPKTKLVELHERVMKLLRATPPDGKGFSDMLSNVLERERNWIKWKVDKCPAYERFPPEASATTTDPPTKKRRLGDAGALGSMPTAARKRRQDDGADTALMQQILSQSSKPSAILEKLRDQSRATIVPMETFTQRFAEAWDPENGIEEEYWPDKDTMYCWRTLRMAIKTNVQHMHRAVDGAGAVVKGILGIKDPVNAAKDPKADASKTEGSEDAAKETDKEQTTDIKTEVVEPATEEGAKSSTATPAPAPSDHEMEDGEL